MKWPAITWDYLVMGDQADLQLKKWIKEIKDLSNKYLKVKKLQLMF